MLLLGSHEASSGLPKKSTTDRPTTPKPTYKPIPRLGSIPRIDIPTLRSADPRLAVGGGGEEPRGGDPRLRLHAAVALVPPRASRRGARLGPGRTDEDADVGDSPAGKGKKHKGVEMGFLELPFGKTPWMGKMWGFISFPLAVLGLVWWLGFGLPPRCWALWSSMGGLDFGFLMNPLQEPGIQFPKPLLEWEDALDGEYHLRLPMGSWVVWGSWVSCWLGN